MGSLCVHIIIYILQKRETVLAPHLCFEVLRKPTIKRYRYNSPRIHVNHCNPILLIVRNFSGFKAQDRSTTLHFLQHGRTRAAFSSFHALGLHVFSHKFIAQQAIRRDKGTNKRAQYKIKDEEFFVFYFYCRVKVP